MAYTTNTLVKTYLGISGSGDDTLLTTLIARAQAAIDSYTNRTFEASGDTTRKFTVGEDTDGDWLFIDEDLCDITTVTNNADASSPETVASTKYITYPRNDTPYFALKLINSSSTNWTYTDDAENGITIAGKWAYSESPPDDIIHACIRLAAYYYRQKDAQVFDVTADPQAGVLLVPQGLPSDVKVILDPFVRATL